MVFCGAVTIAGCGKRSFVGLRRDMDANHLGIFTVIARNPRSQAGAGSKHGDIAGKHVADEFFDARSSCDCSQVLDQQRANAVALPVVVDQNCQLSLAAVQDLVRGDTDGQPVVFCDQGHMIIAGREKPLHLTIN